MARLTAIASSALVCALVGGSVCAQPNLTDRGRPPYLYAVLDPWLHFERQESLIATQADILLGKMALFEPVDGLALPEHMTSPVGRLEFKIRWKDNGQEAANWCTAFLVSDNLAVTNNHCLPGPAPNAAEISAARIRFGYLRPGEPQTSVFKVLRVIETNEELDFSVLELEGTPGRTFGTVPLKTRSTAPAEALNIVGHPNTFPQRVTRAHCRAAPAPVSVGARLRHSCDTYGASSGSPIFAEKDGWLLALHASGAVPFEDGSFNQGILFTEILKSSPALQAIARSDSQVSQPPRISSTVISAVSEVEKLFSDGLIAYREGKFSLAATLFKQAAEKQHAEAAFNLASMHDYGRGVPRDYSEARKWYLVSATSGNAAAMYNVGGLYFYGLAGPCDRQQAFAWYTRAANRGNTDAKYSLGALYQRGDGVDRNLATAVRWYESAADEGMPIAHYQLGQLSEAGSLGAPDYASARRRYEHAASMGYPPAFIALAGLYERGLGVARDLETAHSWRRRGDVARASWPDLSVDLSESSCPL